MRSLAFAALLLVAQGIAAQCPTPDPNVPVGASHANPAPFGAEVALTYNDFSTLPSTTYKARVRALAALRGAAALQALRDRAPGGVADPPAGMEYLLVQLRFALDCGPSADEKLTIHWLSQTRLVSSSLAEYEPSSVEPPIPPLRFGVYPGGSGDGWGSYLVATGDECPFLAVGRDPNGSGGAWLAIPDAPTAHSQTGALGLLVLLAAAVRFSH